MYSGALFLEVLSFVIGTKLLIDLLAGTRISGIKITEWHPDSMNWKLLPAAGGDRELRKPVHCDCEVFYTRCFASRELLRP